MVHMSRTNSAKSSVDVVKAPFGALVVTYKHNSTQGKKARSASSRQAGAQYEENVHVSFQDKMQLVVRIVIAPMGAWVVEQKTLENALVVVGIDGGNVGLRRYNRD